MIHQIYYLDNFQWCHDSMLNAIKFNILFELHSNASMLKKKIKKYNFIF